MSDENIIARWTPEEFLRGDRATFVDPNLQARQDRQRERLRSALARSVEVFQDALIEGSEETARRLHDLGERALAGDQQAMQGFMAMYGELCWQAIRP